MKEKSKKRKIMFLKSSKMGEKEVSLNHNEKKKEKKEKKRAL